MPENNLNLNAINVSSPKTLFEHVMYKLHFLARYINILIASTFIQCNKTVEIMIKLAFLIFNHNLKVYLYLFAIVI